MACMRQTRDEEFLRKLRRVWWDLTSVIAVELMSCNRNEEQLIRRGFRYLQQGTSIWWRWTMEDDGKMKGKRDLLLTDWDDDKQLLNENCCEATMKGTRHLNESFATQEKEQSSLEQTNHHHQQKNQTQHSRWGGSTGKLFCNFIEVCWSEKFHGQQTGIKI